MTDTLVGTVDAAAAASAHSISLTWNASVDSTTAEPGTVNVYRGVNGATPAKYASNQPPAATSASPYVDSSVTGGNTYLYYVTAVIGGAESAPSNTFSGQVGVAAPTNLAGVVA